jgi:hypothetical protein
MFSRSIYLDFFLRSLVGIVVGLFFAAIISEGSFLLMSNKQSAMREPERVNLVIPYGTSEQVKEGVYNRSLPTDMTFVQGDILVVKNEDLVTHQLGPIVLPAQTSGVLEMTQASENRYDCSFQPTNTMGIKVLPRLDSNSRVQGLLAIALPTGMMLAVYSYMIPKTKFSLLKSSKIQE